MAKTELYKALYDPSKGTTCSADEHAHLIAALEGGDLPVALDGMREHLSELEERVVARMQSKTADDLGAVFST